jgi:hypothetical protein
MPVHINEVEASVEVETAHAAATESEPPSEAASLQRWREQWRREQQLAARTAAFEFDD